MTTVTSCPRKILLYIYWQSIITGGISLSSRKLLMLYNKLFGTFGFTTHYQLYPKHVSVYLLDISCFSENNSIICYPPNRLNSASLFSENYFPFLGDRHKSGLQVCIWYHVILKNLDISVIKLSECI